MIGMDRENYFLDIREEGEYNKVFVLIIYDIADNRTRNKLAKLLQGYGFRIQKSAFEAFISKNKYQQLLKILEMFPSGEDSIRVYKIVGKGQVTSFGNSIDNEQEDIIVI